MGSSRFAGFAATALVVIGVSGWAVPAHALIIGAPANIDNCFPFGCATGWGTEYQQVYSASNFSGPITIKSLRFYHSFCCAPDETLNSGSFAIALSTTSKTVNGLDTVLANNLGTDNTLVFNGSLPPLIPFGSFFDIFVDPFPYDPAGGNLLLDVVSTDATNTIGGSLDAFFPAGSATSRAYEDTPFADNLGLVTGFNEVPEPASLVLLGAGLLGFRLLGRRKAMA